MERSRSSDRSIASSLNRIGESRVPLTRASDRLTQNLEAIEETLRSYRVGVEVWLDDAVIESNSHGWLRIPGFGKLNGRYGFGVAEGVDGEPGEDWRVTPLAQLSREDKLAFVERLEHLLDRMAEAAEQKVCTVEKSAHMAASVLTDLQQHAPKKTKRT